MKQEKIGRRRKDRPSRTGGVMNRNSIILAFATLLALAPALTAGCSTSSVTCVSPRIPQGIYATVGIHLYEQNYLKTHSSVPSDYFTGTVYPELLANPDLSGITLYVFWSRLNPNPAPGAVEPPGYYQYDWTILNDIFTTVETYNTTNKTHKTVQLVVTPGINSPTWLLGKPNGKNDGLLKSCNYLFDSTYKPPPAGTECGKVTFSGFSEGGYNKNSGVATAQDVPMPWNSTYKNAWQSFLTALAAEFGSKPELVSIAVAGPTASSEEMILPTIRNTNGVAQLGGFTPEQMWNKLLAHHYTSAYTDYTKYLNSDVAIIDEWEHAIDVFGKTFSELTLTMSTGDGLPNLDAPLPADTPCNLNKGTCSFAMPTSFDFSSVCIVADMDCAAESTVLAYFIQSTVGGPNAKATQMDGMKGGAKHGNLSVPGVKLISESTDLYTSPSQRILGGSQLNQPFTNDAKSAADEGGCPAPTVSTPWPCSREQAFYNVLAWFFDKTNQALSFPPGTVSKNGGHSGTAPLNYLQIWGVDITYASEHVSDPKVPVVGVPTDVSVQDLLHMANLALGMIDEQ